VLHLHRRDDIANLTCKRYDLSLTQANVCCSSMSRVRCFEIRIGRGVGGGTQSAPCLPVRSTSSPQRAFINSTVNFYHNVLSAVLG
jgi:hypothetical protein